MAKLFLESTDTTYKVSSANTKVYGATGSQVVTVDAAATGVTFDANVEGVSFSGATSDFTYKQLGLTDLGSKWIIVIVLKRHCFSKVCDNR